MKPFVEPVTAASFDRNIPGAIDALPGQAAILDACGIILEVNESWRAFARANGYQGEDFGIGTSYLTACGIERANPTRFARQAEQTIRDVQTGTMNVGSFDYPCHAPDEPRWFRMVVSPLQIDDQTGVLVLHFDVTVETMQREKMARTLRQLGKSGGVKNEVAKIVHDVKSPLNAIRGMTDFLRCELAGPTTPKQQEYLTHVLEACDQACTLVDDEISRIFSNDDNTDEFMTDVISTVEAIARDLKAEAIRAGLTIDTNLPDSIPVLAVPSVVVYRMVSNLVVNAIRYAGAGAQISISALAFENKLVITVDDTGVGVPEDEVSELMKPLQRGVQSQATGTGLGLSAVHDLAQNHGATLELTSARNEGMHATISFSAEVVVPNARPLERAVVAA